MLQKERDVAKAKPTNPFAGRWRITHMDEWDQDFVDAEVEGYVEFAADGSGEFQFGYVRGGMDCRLTTRDGQPCVEWTWEGNDEMDEATGRGWAVLKGEELHGLIAFHRGDESGFVAKRVVKGGRKKKGA
jgi:hypothetical protein